MQLASGRRMEGFGNAPGDPPPPPPPEAHEGLVEGLPSGSRNVRMLENADNLPPGLNERMIRATSSGRRMQRFGNAPGDTPPPAPGEGWTEQKQSASSSRTELRPALQPRFKLDFLTGREREEMRLLRLRNRGGSETDSRIRQL
ncbi:hypothetical protein DACRYDRAFT_22614, partial [Dacryopinax primogenitus]